MHFDVAIVGAGAAGLHCAAMAGQRGLKVLLIDHAEKVAEKIRISGGGRCNFTNRDTNATNFVSANPDFCRSALARYSPQDFIDLVERHQIRWHEKHKGQLFCDESSGDIIAMLLAECERGQVTRWQPCAVIAVQQIAQPTASFELQTERGTVAASRLVVATGGLSIPKIGATDFGYRLAAQFGHRIVDTRPALVPLKFAPEAWAAYAPLAGLSLQARVETGQGKARGHFIEDLLFTHRGMSGPAILQISTYWRPGSPLLIDLVPGLDLPGLLSAAKNQSRRKLSNELAEWMPRRLAEACIASDLPALDRPIAEIANLALAGLSRRLQCWDVVPSGTEGYVKAEVTAGGVDTREISSQTMESRKVAGLYFIGEVVDVTGWLGGYNFQWAWASAVACANAMAASQPC